MEKELDNKKMWESVLGVFKEYCATTTLSYKAYMKGLNDQGFEYKDGKIVSIEPERYFGNSEQPLTEFEDAFIHIYEQKYPCELNDKDLDFCRKAAKELLSIARKQIISEIEPEQLTENFKQYVLGEQKPEWSEEDIEMIDWLIRCCEEEHKKLCNDRYGHQEIVSDLKRDCRKKWDWLESLKNRALPQPKQEWSEEDEKMIDAALQFAHEYGRHGLWCWLKSLRPQNRWKPSDVQMELLKEACDKRWEPDGLDPLYTLYQNLKKLREE